MTDSSKEILKNTLSYLQKHDGLTYQQALSKISSVIISGDAENNPLYGHLLEAGLPSETKQLHDLMAPSIGGVYG